MGGLRYATLRCGCICVASVSSGALCPFTPVDPRLRDRARARANNRDRDRDRTRYIGSPTISLGLFLALTPLPSR